MPTALVGHNFTDGSSSGQHPTSSNTTIHSSSGKNHGHFDISRANHALDELEEALNDGEKIQDIMNDSAIDYRDNIVSQDALKPLIIARRAAAKFTLARFCGPVDANNLTHNISALNNYIRLYGDDPVAVRDTLKNISSPIKKSKSKELKRLGVQPNRSYSLNDGSFKYSPRRQRSALPALGNRH